MAAFSGSSGGSTGLLGLSATWASRQRQVRDHSCEKTSVCDLGLLSSPLESRPSWVGSGSPPAKNTIRLSL